MYFLKNHFLTNRILKNSTLISTALVAINLTACQSLPKPKPTQSEQAPQVNATSPAVAEAPTFAITGKIGVTTVIDGKREAGSAFYAWGQDGNRFAIDLTGVLGMGATRITFDGNTATLISDKGELTADSPNELLTKATGWHAPITALPYWIIGKPAPNDTDSHFENGDNGKLTSSQNDDWTAEISYTDTLPNRLKITHKDGHRVLMTINHQ